MTRTIEIETESKKFTVSNIPDNAKITYGGLRPDQPGGKTNTLRIYTAGQNQLAVFREVVCFHDVSLKIEECGPIKDTWIDP